MASITRSGARCLNTFKGFLSSDHKSLQILSKQYSRSVNKSVPVSQYYRDTSYESRRKVGNEEAAIHEGSNTGNTNMEYVYKDPDTFGFISRSTEDFHRKYEQDEGDKREEEYLGHAPMPYQRLSTKKYADMIKEHLESNRVKEALDVLETLMLKEHRVRPENYIYNLLIGGCARVGYTKKAFMLFNDMKRRGLKVTGGTYTSLFNSCSNSPWKEDGGQRATKLREFMAEKAIEPNLTNYNSMIKAFGHVGDLHTAFQIVDEMLTKKIKIRVHTFNFLLHSCISDKAAGFRHALVIWRKMLMKKEKPNVYSFNLMLRCVKECNFGDSTAGIELLNKLLQSKVPSNVPLLVISKTSTEVPALTKIKETNLPSALSANTTIPSLLSPRPYLDNVVQIKEMSALEDRFAAVGGVRGFLNEMHFFNVTPDIKTITQLLDVMPSTMEDEQLLLDSIKFWKIKPDIDFFNILIKKRCFRHDYDAAKDVRKLIELSAKKNKESYFKKKYVKPNIMTYGVLALTCNTKQAAEELVKEMKDSRLRINVEVMGTLLKHAALNNDVEYMMYVMEVMKSEDIQPNQVFMRHLDRYKMSVRTQKYLDSDEISEDKKKMYKKILKMYPKSEEQEPELSAEHPWTQFRNPQPATFQKPTSHPKPKRIPFYKSKTRMRLKAARIRFTRRR